MDQPPPTAVLHHHLHQESSESYSPTCRQWDDTLPPPKLRLMCSYGGHIIPRPHDKSLCYMGGETRIVVADRHTSLADLCSRISATLLNGRQFSLKYQLPTEDLDSLVSITTDEDLDNMVEEYDRFNSSNQLGKQSRLRLFLFLSKPDTAASMGSLLDDAKSETWFVDALNGAGLLPRGFSDPAAVDNLLEPKDGELFQIEKLSGDVDHQVILADSPMVETTSSIGSSLSSPSVCNLAPIRVRVEYVNNAMAGVEEKLAQLNVDGEERSDHGGGILPSGGMMTRKPPLPLQPVQRKFGNDAYSLPSPDSKHGGAYGLHSPDSIASDGSVASASKPTLTQDPAQFFPQIQVQQTPNSSETKPNQDQTRHQPYQTRPHYINHPKTNQPVSSYYHPVYAQPPQMDHQPYPLYFLPVSQNHQYAGMQLQTNPTDAIAPPTTASPPLYATQTGVPLTNPDMVTNTLGMIQVASNNQVQQPYMSISQSHIHNPTQMATANGVNYGYEYAYPTQEQVYFTQHQSGSQYQTVTPGSAMLMTQMATSQKPAQESAKQ